MCLLLIAYKKHPNYKIIVAANRDEFHERPTKPAHFWTENNSLLAGKDLKENGTWLGITKTGRFAALTNYRDMSKIKTNAPTRGKLVSNFLLENIDAKDYHKILLKKSDEYNGYNLIFGDINNLFYLSNVSREFKEINERIHGLSNHLLDTPWPKVTKAKQKFMEILKDNKPHEEKIFSLLFDSTTFPDKDLPKTGLPAEMERLVSPIFTVTEKYGTRSSTVILIDNDDNISFTEKSFNSKKENINTNHFSFKIKN